MAPMDAHAPRISDRVRQKLKDSVERNKVTIVVGPTGCGKSTQVPQALFDGLNLGPVLCTQPRRLAVVSVATRVASERHAVLGGDEVGYHVGQSNQSMHNTRLLFTTAGILLEEIRVNGVTALTKYSCVIIDECHERSPESDLVLVMCKNLLKGNPSKKIRIVLMSATFDHQRYQAYFEEITRTIDVITLETADSFEVYHDRVKVRYLQDTIRLLPDSQSHNHFLSSMRMAPDEDLMGKDSGRSLSDNMLKLILSLVQHLHSVEDEEHAFVLFAPTYRHLEQIYSLLRLAVPSDQPWRVEVLHSSVDMAKCLRTMQEASSNNARKILLCSAIAESSVTIPGVSVVIDLCRALQVKWDQRKKTRIPKTVWASRAICDQRKGRTGRTCAGQVFRLIPTAFYSNDLPAYEIPQLALSSCRDELLMLICSRDRKSISTPEALLKQCLDPPPERTILASVEYLEELGACVKTKKGFLPTKSGELMSALAFPVEESHMILLGARMALLHEVLVLRAIATHKPTPLVHYFGDNDRNERLLKRFFPSVRMGSQTSVNLAHLAAFFQWDYTWNKSRSKAAMQEFVMSTTPPGASSVSEDLLSFTNEANNKLKPCGDVWKWTVELEEKHTQWCQEMEINPTAVKTISDVIESAMNVFYAANFEPEWLRSQDPTPQWLRPHESPAGGSSMIAVAYGEAKGKVLEDALTALIDNPSWAAEYAAALKGKTTSSPPPTQQQTFACIHFLRGNCTYGSSCRNSHSHSATRPPCRYFMSGTCSNGSRCLFSHDYAVIGAATKKDRSLVVEGKDSLSAIAPPLPALAPIASLDWFRSHSPELFLLGEGKFEFTRALTALGIPAAFASDVQQISASPIFSSTALSTVDATRIHRNEFVMSLLQSGRVGSFAWNFPYTGSEEDNSSQVSLILGTFLSLSCLIGNDGPANRHYHLALTLQGDQFSRWSVWLSSLRTGWRLRNWSTFKPSEYPTYSPKRSNGETFPESKARIYYFTYWKG